MMKIIEQDIKNILKLLLYLTIVVLMWMPVFIGYWWITITIFIGIYIWGYFDGVFNRAKGISKPISEEYW